MGVTIQNTEVTDIDPEESIGSNMDDLSFSFDLENFSDLDFEIEQEFETRYIKPPKSKENKYLKYENAKKLASQISELSKFNYRILVNGSFIFGDFIEAFIVHFNLKVKELTLSTLSIGLDNVDSLKNLLIGGYVDKLNLITSGYFYSHERFNLVPYMYQQLDIEDKFQYAAADSHCKIYLFELESGQKITIEGSVNLRSSDNIEQFSIEMDSELYDFYFDYQSKILEKYKTINKTIRGKKQISNILNIKK